MSGYPCQDQAQVAAVLEANFGSIAGEYSSAGLQQDGFSLSSYHQKYLKGYTVLDVGAFDGNGSFKAITVMDANGNIYVHFNGTGDGNWGHNSAAYGPENSPMQQWASDYFDGVVQKYYEGQSAGRSLYVSGHSQGGNNAQYVTLNSKYGDYIDACVSMDGPGMSQDVLEATKNRYGEAYYQQQRDKMYAYNGESDYVSCLGQETVIAEDHTYLIDVSEGYKGSPDDNFAFQYHASNYLMNEDGTLGAITPYTYDANSDFRKLVLAMNEQLKRLPPEQQYAAAQAMMALIEQSIGSGEHVMTQERLNDLKQALAPVLIGLLEEHPEMIGPALETIAGDDPSLAQLTEYRELLEEIVNRFNSLPEDVRTQALEAVMDCVVLDENGNISFQWQNLFKDGNLLPVLETAIPLLVETFLYHPENLAELIEKLGLDVKLGEYLSEHPIVAVALVLLSPLLLRLARDLTAVLILADIFLRVVQGLVTLAQGIRDFVVQCVQALKRAVRAISKWLRNTFNAGVKYAQNNPYFRANPEDLRTCAGRIASVNSRLRTLDSDLRSLYWQVGLLDLWDILMANLITSGSPTLGQVQNYLNHAAGLLEDAENKARGYVGG